MSGTHKLLSIGSELRAVMDRFESAIATIAPHRATDSIDRGARSGNLMLVLPFFLIEAFEFDGDAKAARLMSVGNAFAATHFLAQDRLMDSTGRPAPRSFHMCDRCYALFLREYARLLPPDSPFWVHFDRYLDEYFASLAWEREELWSDKARSLDNQQVYEFALSQLGRKIAPLKTTCAAVSALSEASDALRPLERMIEAYHVAYQISDDISDMTEDLEAGRPSLAAWTIARAAGLERPPSHADGRELLRTAVRCGALARLAGEVDRHYLRAQGIARELGLISLEAYLAESRQAAAGAYSWIARRTRIVSGVSEAERDGPGASLGGDCTHARPGGGAAREPASTLGSVGQPHDYAAHTLASEGQAYDYIEEMDLDPDVHWYEARGDRLVYDAASGLLFDADAVSCELLSWISRGRPAAELAAMKMNYGSDAVVGAIREISYLAGDERDGLCQTPGTRPAPWLAGHGGVTSLALDVTDRCNLACDYCYSTRPRAPGSSGFMAEDVAFRAVDLLLDESFGEPHVSLVFFGGEPLLNVPLIENVIVYTTSRISSERRAVSFHLTTNGTLLTGDIASFLHSSGVKVLVSIDGCAESHDAHRLFTGGEGSYGAIVSNLSKLPSGMRVGARATISEDSRPVPEIVTHLAELGFTTVHLSPVSGVPMSRSFSDRLAHELDELARVELDRLRAGEAPLVGNFAEPILAMETARRRFAPCGAGVRYLCATPSGELFLCHRFAHDRRYRVGDVFDGVDRGASRGLLSKLAGETGPCSGCWARHLCGGPCYYDIRASFPEGLGFDSPRCSLKRRIFELSMWLYASLPDRAKERLREHARRIVRPELLGAGSESGGGA